jgi:TPR repeat protein
MTVDRQQAESGDAHAQLRMGLRCLEGRDVPRDPQEAARWLRRAAEQGLPEAQFRLGQLYEAGDGVDPAPEKAWRLCEQAAAGGNADAQLRIAQRWLAHRSMSRRRVALHWLFAAAKLGHAEAKRCLGDLYGDTVPEDPEQAARWLRAAAAAQARVLDPKLSTARGAEYGGRQRLGQTEAGAEDSTHQESSDRSRERRGLGHLNSALAIGETLAARLASGDWHHHFDQRIAALSMAEKNEGPPRSPEACQDVISLTRAAGGHALAAIELAPEVCGSVETGNALGIPITLEDGDVGPDAPANEPEAALGRLSLSGGSLWLATEAGPCRLLPAGVSEGLAAEALDVFKAVMLGSRAAVLRLADCVGGHETIRRPVGGRPPCGDVPQEHLVQLEHAIWWVGPYWLAVSAAGLGRFESFSRAQEGTDPEREVRWLGSMLWDLQLLRPPFPAMG